ncbi:Mitogen-activated protein kinase kinase protein [Dioscorea alata]|uniref:Mitogen-activated protein kinase kinase protein n=1 Tax=Dioscorea alata TaxID=55571 RepID=A0ACB7U6Y2_DIOAL|nr:Mitogen-activated protein kinase kinase protein [Dioscorea alata]
MAAVRERRLPQLTLPLDLPADGRGSRLHLPPLPPPASSSEHHFSDFDKLEVLGHGNGGIVYKVCHRTTAALYALKVLNAGDPQSRRHAAREVEILRRAADHPSVVRCHGVLPAPSGDVAVLLELMDFGSLDSLQLRRRSRPIPEPALSAIARQALLGLSYLHSLQIAHRDIKPSNLLINAAGEVKIADFGVGKIVRRALDKCVSYVGTCAYMSPERFNPAAHGGAGYDGYAGDIWGLGLTIMELGMGRFPLLPAGERPDWAALMWAICFGETPAIPDSVEASPELRDFVSQCLQKDAAKRWTVAQLLDHPFVAGKERASPELAVRELLVDSDCNSP